MLYRIWHIAQLFLLIQACSGLSTELLRRLLHDEPNEQLHDLGQISDAVGSLERTFLSPAHKKAAVKIQHIMEEAGMDAYIDKVANVRGRVRGREKNAPVLLLGSHYDTVKDAGRFDGILGVLVPIAAVKALLIEAAVNAGELKESELLKTTTISIADHLKRSQIMRLVASPVEVIAFSEEEGVRFQTTFLGSRAIVGDLIGSGVLDAEDKLGISVREALALPKDPKSDRFLSNLAYKPEQVKGYVEVHMEQGPILESKGLPLGVVTGIAGQTRQHVMMTGIQGHAGTIPMPMRKDPATAAAEAILWLEQRCGGGSYEELSSLVSPEESLMCTTGSINLWPNAFNVVPGSANFSLDIRSRKDTVWQKVAADAHSHIDEICKRRGLICEVQQKTAANAVHSDENLLGKLVDAIKGSQKLTSQLLPQADAGGCSVGDLPPSDELQSCRSPDALSDVDGLGRKEPTLAAYDPPRLVSGAGHDALALAKLTKMAMVFVRCVGGHSHSPLEHVTEADVAASAAATYMFLQAELLHGLS